MPNPRLAALVLSLGLALGVSSAVAAEVRCAGPYLRISQLPHGGFNTYDQLKRRAPRIAPCDTVAPLAYCPVLDPWGYVDTFSDVTRTQTFTGPKERYLVSRTAKRDQKAQLPYGILWSDTVSTAMGRLRSLGLDPRHGPGGEHGPGSDIEVGGCSPYKSDPGFLTTLHFDPAGVLQSVERRDQED